MNSTLNLPYGLFEDILLRLDVKLLCQCKFVAKSWWVCIKNPKFAKKQLKCNDQERRLRTERLFLILRPFRFFSLDLESTVSYPVPHEFRGVQLRHENFINNRMYDPFTVQTVFLSCDGMLFLGDLNHTLFLANPSTGEIIQLPEPPFVDADGIIMHRYAFGYDPSTDDYKVVRISLLGPELEENENFVSVYNLRANSWRRIEGPEHRVAPFPAAQGVHVNGALHWFGDEGGIVSFDLVTECFRSIPFPTFDGGVKQRRQLNVIGECLCLVDYEYRANAYFSVWILKNHGVIDSWKRFIVNCSPSSLVWIETSRTGKLLLFTGTELVSYDPQDGRHEVKAVRGVNREFEVVTFEESLIRLQGQDE